MITCKDLKEKFDIYEEWIEEYKHHLEILKKDHELMADKGFKFFFAVDFYDILNFCFPYGLFIGKKKYYKDEKRRKELMDLQFARSFLFYATEAKPVVLLPPYAREASDFIESTWSELKNLRNDVLKQEILKILFRDEKVQDVIENLRGNIGTREEQRELLEKISESSSSIFFLLSSGFLKGMDVFINLLKKHKVNNREYMLISPDPPNVKSYKDILEKTPEENFEIERLFRSRSRKRIQNIRDAKALQYIKELNKSMQENEQVIFLVSNADYMKKKIKGKLSVDIGGVKYDLLRDLETLYVYLIEIRDIVVSNRKPSQKEILNKIKKSLKEFENFSKLSQGIPKLTSECELFKEGRPFDEHTEDECPFVEEINEINESLEKIGELKNSIENINLMKQIEVILSPLFSVESKTFLDLRFNDRYKNYEDELLFIYDKIQKLFEDKKTFYETLDELEGQLEDLRLQEFFSISSDSLSTQRPFANINNPLFLHRLPFRSEIRGEEFKEMFSDIWDKATACRDEYLRTSEVSEENRRKLDESLRKLVRYSRGIEDERKYIVWQIIFLCNKRYDLVRIWNEYYKNQMKNEEMKKESDYLFCLANYFDMENYEGSFRYLYPICKEHIKNRDSDLRFYHILSLALISLFEKSSDKKRFKYTRKDLVELFEKEFINRIGELKDPEFRRAIYNNYCYAIFLLIDYQDSKIEYLDMADKARRIMKDMEEKTDEKEWLYNLDDTLGCIYFLFAKYFGKNKLEYAKKSMRYFNRAEKFYNESDIEIRRKYIEECRRILEESSKCNSV